MGHPMRRKDRELTKEDALEILRNAEYGVLSTLGDDGFPYGVPLSYVLVDGAIYFHCARIGHKIENIAANPKASFCAVTGVEAVFDDGFTTNYASAIAFGEAVLVEDEAERVLALRRLSEKYLMAHMDKFEGEMARHGKMAAVYKILIRELSGKSRRGNPPVIR